MKAGLPQAFKCAAQVQQAHLSGFSKHSDSADNGQVFNKNEVVDGRSIGNNDHPPLKRGQFFCYPKSHFRSVPVS